MHDDQGWRWPRIAAAALVASVCTALAAAPLQIAVAAIIGPAALILIARRARRASHAAIWVAVLQIPLWLWLERWVGPIANAGWAAMAIYMTTWPVAFCLLLRFVAAKGCLRHWPSAVLAPVLWVGLECLRGIVIFDGYPWFLAGSSLVGMPLAQIADLGGVWLVSLLAISISGVLADWRSGDRSTAIAVLAVMMLAWGYGFWRLREEHGGETTSVLIVQTNVPQTNKMAWTWEQQQQDVAEAISLTVTSPHLTKADVVVWPETMLPGAGFEVSMADFLPSPESFEALWSWSIVAEQLTTSIGKPLLVGTQTWIGAAVEEDGQMLRATFEQQFNSAVLVTPGAATSRYDKLFLTPFGERMPYLEYWPGLAEWARQTAGTEMLFDLTASDEATRLSLERQDGTVVRLATPICFEDTVPWVCRALCFESGDRAADLLVNLSNDGWFGSVDAGRWQHVLEARMRCITNRTPMVRVANTGVSCLIDSEGTVHATGPTAEESPLMRSSGTWLVETTSDDRMPTARFVGDSVAWFSLFGGILLVIARLLPFCTEPDSCSGE